MSQAGLVLLRQPVQLDLVAPANAARVADDAVRVRLVAALAPYAPARAQVSVERVRRVLEGARKPDAARSSEPVASSEKATPV